MKTLQKYGGFSALYLMAVTVYAESGIKLPVGEAWLKDTAQTKEVLAANEIAA